MLLATQVSDYTLVPAKDVDGEVVLLFNLSDLLDWRWSIDSCEIEAIICDVISGSNWVFGCWKLSRS